MFTRSYNENCQQCGECRWWVGGGGDRILKLTLSTKTASEVSERQCTVHRTRLHRTELDFYIGQSTSRTG
ncbi:hypothetical protein J6590_056751 [Homalodisca vitripennis]|nr:hypothetical protein J6590_056751 [Homalodisca vitripennis]